METNALRAFVRTMERGSVTAAARDLALSQPAVTKHLRNLERHVGVRLFERTARSIHPTAQGRALYEASRSSLAALDAALEGARHDGSAVEGQIRVFAPSCLGSRQLYDAVAEFQVSHPAVSVDLVLDMRQVDLIHENFDLAVGYAKPDARDMIVRRIGAGQLVRVLPDCEVKTNDVFLSYPSARHMRPAVRAFIDHLVPRLKAVEGID